MDKVANTLDKTWGFVDADRPTRQLSVVVPVCNEAESIGPVMERLFKVLDVHFAGLTGAFEVIAVNDGSTDGMLGKLREYAPLRPELKVVEFRRNYGQTATIVAGIEFTRGEVLVLIDSDLENDPEGAARRLRHLDEGGGLGLPRVAQ